jgi:hypothetical protein
MSDSLEQMMEMDRVKAILVLGLAILGAMIPRATADEWDQKTVFTFSGPVEVPGQVLPAGTCVFKLADFPSDRNIVKVFSQDERHLFATFLAIPDYRLSRPGKRSLRSKSGPPVLRRLSKHGSIPARITAMSLFIQSRGRWNWPR